MKPLENVTFLELVLFALYMSLGYFFYQFELAPEPNYAEATKDAFTTLWAMVGFYFAKRYFM